MIRTIRLITAGNGEDEINTILGIIDTSKVKLKRIENYTELGRREFLFTNEDETIKIKLVCESII